MKSKDAFQITAVGMHKIAEAERRAFHLKAEQSEQEAELLRRSGNLDRAKKFLEQETKWRAKMAQSDEAIYKDYKAQGRDSRSGVGKNTVKMAHGAGESAKKDAATKGASKEEAQAVYQKVYMSTLAQLLGGESSQAKAQDGILSSPFMALAALLAILSHFSDDKVGPDDYNLLTYKPKRKTF